MKIAKEFRWEMGHRLLNHKGLCRNIHGHSYRMVVEIEGKVNKEGMIIDFFDLGIIIKPIIETYDHSFLCWEGDKTMKDFLLKHEMKCVVVKFHSTVENICGHFTDVILKELKKLKINTFDTLTVKVYETPNAFAEVSKRFR